MRWFLFIDYKFTNRYEYTNKDYGITLPSGCEKDMMLSMISKRAFGTHKW
jgi:hypothetical protein